MFLPESELTNSSKKRLRFSNFFEALRFAEMPHVEVVLNAGEVTQEAARLLVKPESKLSAFLPKVDGDRSERPVEKPLPNIYALW